MSTAFHATPSTRIVFAPLEGPDGFFVSKGIEIYHGKKPERLRRVERRWPFIPFHLWDTSCGTSKTRTVIGCARILSRMSHNFSYTNIFLILASNFSL